MKKKTAFFLGALGWLMLLFALVLGAVRDVGLDPQVYYDLQREAGVHETAGISEANLLQLDVSLANYLAGKYDDPNLEIEVYGEMQPAFNERELIHLADCRRLFAPTMSLWLNIGLAVVGVALLVPLGERGFTMNNIGTVWLAAAVLALPIAILAVWAAIDFNAAFDFFHRLLFTNELWMLNPETDLLIRICPASMFANMGMRIGIRCGLILVGLPLLTTVLHKLDKRRKKKNA